MSTPFMGLTLPTPTVTPGPLYAQENNQAFLTIDSHDHSPGNGAPIPSVSLNVNSDLSFNSFNVNLLRSTRFAIQSAPLSLAADVASLYSVGGNLYYNNGAGQAIQLTVGAALNATSIGAIGGDYSTSTASEFYTSADSTFTFWSASNTSASIDGGPLTIRNNIANSKGITISAPIGLSADMGLTLFPSLPPSTKILTVDSSGNIADVYDVDNSTIDVSANIIRVKPGGITQTQAAPGFGLVPSGVFLPYGGTVAPTGYLLCDGSSYLRTDYPNLFAAIGTAYGAADGTHFNVPDTRGQFIRGVDGSAGRDPDSTSRTAANPGGNTGNNVGSIQSDQFKSHTHGTSYSFFSAGGGSTVAATTITNGGILFSITAAGGAETRPTNVYANYIIKT